MTKKTLEAFEPSANCSHPDDCRLYGSCLEAHTLAENTVFARKNPTKDNLDTVKFNLGRFNCLHRQLEEAKEDARKLLAGN